MQKPVEPEDPIKATIAALDDHGDFRTLPDGNLIWDDYLVVHRIMTR